MHFFYFHESLLCKGINENLQFLTQSVFKKNTRSNKLFFIKIVWQLPFLKEHPPPLLIFDSHFIESVVLFFREKEIELVLNVIDTKVKNKNCLKFFP